MGEPMKKKETLPSSGFNQKNEWPTAVSRFNRQPVPVEVSEANPMRANYLMLGHFAHPSLGALSGFPIHT
jgi:hypothetical protein